MDLDSDIKNESALDFLIKNRNIKVEQKSFSFLDTIEKEILEYYIPNEKTRDMFIKKFNDLLEHLPANNGNLYSICIPKNVEGVFYISKPYGISVDEETESQTLQDLDKIQAGKQEGGELQARILASQLKPENGVVVQLHSTLADKTINKIEKDIDFLIQQSLMQFRLRESKYLSEVINTLVELGIDRDDVNPETLVKDLEEAKYGNLNLTGFIEKLEERFNCEIPEEDDEKIKTMTVRDLALYINGKV